MHKTHLWFSTTTPVHLVREFSALSAPNCDSDKMRVVTQYFLEFFSLSVALYNFLDSLISLCFSVDFDTEGNRVVSGVARDQHVQTLCSVCRLSWIFADLYHLTTYVADSRVQVYKEVADIFASFPGLYNSWFSWL